MLGTALNHFASDMDRAGQLRLHAIALPVGVRQFLPRLRRQKASASETVPLTPEIPASASEPATIASKTVASASRIVSLTSEMAVSASEFAACASRREACTCEKDTCCCEKDTCACEGDTNASERAMRTPWKKTGAFGRETCASFETASECLVSWPRQARGACAHE